MQFAAFLIVYMQVGSVQSSPLFSTSMVQLDAVYDDYQTCMNETNDLEVAGAKFWTAIDEVSLPGDHSFIYACAPIPKE